MNTILAAAGWLITEWTIALAAFLTASGVIWQKVVVPLRGFVRKFKAWMLRIEESVGLVEAQMKPNSGKTLMDKVAAASVERDQIARDITEIKQQVAVLIKHDLERDQPGRRYGGEETP